MADNQCPIAAVPDKEYDRVWAMVEAITAHENHFNELESRYRTLASTWLFAVFGASGFLLAQEHLDIPVERAFLIAGIAGAGIAGMVLLFIVDLLVYHQLLAANFSEGLRLEQQHAWLPQVRTKMMSTQKRRRLGEVGVAPRIAWFYIIAVLVLGAVAAGGVAAGFADSSAAAAAAGAATTLGTATAIGRELHRRTLWMERVPKPSAAPAGSGRSGC